MSIVRAGAALGWKVVEDKPGVLIATLEIRKHQAIVEIPYSTTKFSITYKSSINLDESNGQIHKAYNGWILGASVGTVKIPNLGLPEVVRYVPLIASGVLIVSFSIEHIIALLRGEEVVPSWN